MRKYNKTPQNANQITKQTHSANLTPNRDINRYARDYIHSDNDFESVMVHFRRQKILEILRHYKPKSVLEIGCGIQSIFDFYVDYERFVVVEPSELFLRFYRKV